MISSDFRVILAVFVKRGRDAGLALPYARAAVRRGLVDELHVWDQTGDAVVEEPGKASVGLDGYVYSTLKRFQLRAGATGGATLEFSSPDTQVLLHDVSDGRVFAEVVLGGWGNTACAIRRLPQGPVIQEVRSGVRTDGSSNVVRFDLCDSTGELRVVVNGDGDSPVVLTDKFPAGVVSCDISVCTWNQPGSVTFERRLNASNERLFRVPDVGASSEYYAALRCKGTALVVVQDVAFIDLDGLERFVSHLRSGQSTGSLFSPYVLGDEASAAAFDFGPAGSPDYHAKFLEDPVAFVEGFESECFGVTTLGNDKDRAAVPHCVRALYLAASPDRADEVRRALALAGSELDEGVVITITAYCFAVRADERLKDENTLRSYAELANASSA